MGTQLDNDPDAIEARVTALDLTMISLKLQDAEESVGWTADYVGLVEPEYRRFLCLTGWYPNEAIVPSKVIDTFWHTHILDTQAYALDCERTFGYFVHHFPYFGMRGPEDAANLGTAYDNTLFLYDRHFGQPPSDLWVRTGAARCPNCGVRCRKVVALGAAGR